MSSATKTNELHRAHVIAGYKAALHNPKTSESAKTNVRQQLEILQGYNEEQQDAHNNRVLGGFKAALHNPNTSEEAKNRAREVLSAAGVDVGETHSSTGDSEHAHRVLGGYKAAVANPNTSDTAKARAQEFLEKGDPSP